MSRAERIKPNKMHQTLHKPRQLCTLSFLVAVVVLQLLYVHFSLAILTLQNPTPGHLTLLRIATQ